MNSIRICGIYLAAGQSRRMGENKLALPFKKTTIGSSALRAALESALDHIIVVTKQDDSLEWMNSSFFQSPYREKWTLVPCPDARLGQAHSLTCGVLSALDRKPDGMMVILADQPFLLEDRINELIFLSEQVYRKNKIGDIPYIAASYLGKPRPPVLFFQQLVPPLLQLNGDEGARQLFRKSSALKGILIEMEDENTFFDIDTKEDYARAVKGVGLIR
ncbi:NTP transferase domain-containing protein [Bacillus sp. EB600]|uniref:NTP transferase domain-containing protein n=1 Tax=Bacillus sp. EB600 TaxID=2806345 RepID=UPI00210DA354|nr:NTP transferase domain-containing protein [Bacillus sp. EB600]MCQ6282325.1 NTP transferase domain-containing protein [Bacillus sp. EB600]